jgi:diguanylate cyclase (GGDEF)-like protein
VRRAPLRVEARVLLTTLALALVPLALGGGVLLYMLERHGEATTSALLREDAKSALMILVGELRERLDGKSYELADGEIRLLPGAATPESRTALPLEGLFAYIAQPPYGTDRCLLVDDRLQWCSDPSFRPDLPPRAAGEALATPVTVPCHDETCVVRAFRIGGELLGLGNTSLTSLTFRRSSVAYALQRSLRYWLPVSLLLVGAAAAFVAQAEIRRRLTPLGVLVQGTRRFAHGDFDARIDLAGKDEFSELGRAFDDLGARLRSQFRTLEAFGAIDREMVEAPDALRVSTQLCRLAVATLGAQRVIVWLQPAADGDRVVVHLDAGRDRELLHRRVEAPGPLDPEALAALLEPDEDVDRRLEPIRVGDEVVGWFGALAPRALTESLSFSDFADRIALAFDSHRTREALDRQARYDALTGLPNRMLMEDRLEGAALRAERSGTRVAVCFVDLDHFKEVNDTEGHQAGDRLLKAMAQRLRDTVREADTVARFGGDEFVIVAEDIGTDASLREFLERLVRALEAPLPVGGRSVRITASVGVAVFPDDTRSLERLLSYADVAMYRCKETGRAGYRLFDDAMNAELIERRRIVERLRLAIENEALEVVFQPQVTTNGVVVGAELLVRWTDEELGFVSPGRFIPIAEESGLITAIGDWTFRQACRAWQRLEERGLAIDHISVNVSQVDACDAAFPSRMRRLLAEERASARNVSIEITETMLSRSNRTLLENAESLRGLGLRIALDDFGTGYSSLAMLRTLPVDVVKVDRAFVDPVDRDEDAQTIVRAIVAMARALSKDVVIEGLETEAQLRFLESVGCDVYQGYHFARPMAFDAFAEFVAEHGAHRRPSLSAAASG